MPNRRACLRRIAATPAGVAAAQTGIVKANSVGRTFEGVAYNPQTLEIIGVVEATGKLSGPKMSGDLDVENRNYSLESVDAVVDEEVSKYAKTAQKIGVGFEGRSAGYLTLTDRKISGYILPPDQDERPGEITNRVAFSLVDSDVGSVDDQMAVIEQIGRWSQ